MRVVRRAGLMGKTPPPPGCLNARDGWRPVTAAAGRRERPGPLGYRGEETRDPRQDPSSSVEMMEEAPGLEDEEWLVAALAPRRPRSDPYAEASFVLGAQPALPTPSEDRRGSRRLVMKRKVLRHRPDGGVEVSDESAASEPDSDAEVLSLRQKMLQLRTFAEDSISEGEIEMSSSSLDEPPSCWPHGDSPPFLLGGFGSRSSPASQYTAAAGQPKSFIPPRFEPLGRNQGKTDRVAKYFEYKREWEKFRIPGEDQRQELRWGIREQMLCKPELPGRPQHLYAPNPYIVPTEKKRAALRWEVRWDLANGLVPRKHTSS
ncbi:centriolar and ciliogenesis-associated protein HYLS1 isoform X1 [Phalacrocorax aristotelis]|uniref:centriolar and ciliogenesis-associated protein HYLS1 isoform X1 n=2 Tax=Phalacrocorax aristotelis TaxID=126867 RepID=UPI003F4C7FBC